MTEIKFWITAFDCRDASVTAILCQCFKYTFTVLVLPIKNTKSRGVPQVYCEATHKCLHAHIPVWIYAAGV